MIDKIVKGWDAKGLVRYLMGRGDHNEHTRPTVIGAWQSDPGALQPDLVGPGDFDFDPAEFTALLDHVNATAEAAELPRRQPQTGEPGYTKHGYVWHCSLSLSAEEGKLSHAQWNEIARDVMDRTGIAPEGDAGGCRWIAVHHGQSTEGNDHIHIAAVLVRQDTGRRFHPKNDFGVTRTVMRDWEDRLGLRATAINDGSAAPSASRGEIEKASTRMRQGYEGLSRGEAGKAAKIQLRQVVTETAAMSADSEQFLSELRSQGVLVHLHCNDEGRIDGYAVADPEDRDAKTGRPIFFGGRKLAPELSWVKLSARWSGDAALAVPETGRAHEVLLSIAGVVRGSAVAVRGRTESPVAVAKSVQPLLAVWARVADGAQRRGELSRAAWSFDRAGRMPKSLESPPAGEMARALRASTRQLSRVGVVSGRGLTRDAGLELALAFSELLLEIAAWHEVSKRSHHGEAATRSARCVGRFADEAGLGVSGAPRTTAAVVDGVRDRAPSRGRTPRASASSTPDWLPRRGEERQL
ncbi:relaxase/mobilization nuclease domain-containing protein [Rhodococcus qingshengii]|uniref:relaxase/mobilization nuclease domain-containing protein n=1 Tax=Rhodococcus qingshengii TaxID=334542 RepID=UPI001BEC1DD2|nr:relaxase/mobilization nuclease domain-containing protein [Rhodococcus qingshengii]MBT2272727.1 relaxase/mobilization nuclease domain-containing protein [Rhodococcus qingshengii]